VLIFHLCTNFRAHHLDGAHELRLLPSALHMDHAMMHIPHVGNHFQGHSVPFLFVCINWGTRLCRLVVQHADFISTVMLWVWLSHDFLPIKSDDGF